MPLRRESKQGGRIRAQVRGAPILFGAAFYGLFALLIYVSCQFWWELGMRFTPGESGLIALGFFLLHVGLVHRRVASVDPVIWLPISFLIFHFGMVFSIEVLNFDYGGQGYDAWHQGKLSKSLARGHWAALLTVVCFTWGIYLAGVRDLSKGASEMPAVDPSRLGLTALIFTLGAMMMVAIGITVVGPSVAFGLYGDWWAAKDAGADQRLLDVGQFFMMAGSFALVASSDTRRRSLRFFAYFTAAMVAVVSIQKGDRGILVALGIGMGWCYAQRIRRIPWLPVVAAAFFMIVLIPVLAEWRDSRSVETSQRLSVRELVGAAAYAMGGQVNAFVYTLDIVPEVKGYAWGYSFWAAVRNAIPNPLPTKGTSPFSLSTLESSPSAWISSIVAPEWWEMGGGYGYAFGAELYYNFGLPGILIGSTLLGWGTGRIRNASAGSAMRLTASALWLAAVATVVRNTLGFPLRIATWPLVGLYLTSLIVRVLSRSPARPRVPTAPLHAADVPLREPGAGGP